MIKGVHGIMPGPFCLNAHGLKRGDTVGDGGPDFVHPDIRVHREVVEINGGVDVAVGSDLIGAAPVFAHVHAGGIDRQG